MLEGASVVQRLRECLLMMAEVEGQRIHQSGVQGRAAAGVEWRAAGALLRGTGRIKGAELAQQELAQRSTGGEDR